MLGADEQDSEFHEVLREADDLGGLPVVVADLHSALPAILAGYPGRQGAGHRAPRIAYVMLDGGALPAWFSRTTAALTEAGWLTGTVTVGQAFGGDLEAVSLHSGLLAARHVLDAELAVVAQGPGNLGTGTRVGLLRRRRRRRHQRCGRARRQADRIAADQRRRPAERHRGISHHSLTVLWPGRAGQGRHRDT